MGGCFLARPSRSCTSPGALSAPSSTVKVVTQSRHSRRASGPSRLRWSDSNHRNKRYGFRTGGSVELNLRLRGNPNLREALTVTHEDPSIRYHKYSVHGLVTGSRGEPVAAATIRFREVGSTASRAVTDVCRSDELGRFLVSGWAPAPIRWRLSIEAAGYVPYVHPDFDLTSEESRAINIRLRPR